jgi:hypothetical protein
MAGGALEKRARAGKFSRSFSDGRMGLLPVPRDGGAVVVVVLGAEETAVEPLRVRERMGRGFQGTGIGGVEAGVKALLLVWRSHCATRPVREGMLFSEGVEGEVLDVDEDVPVDDGVLSVGRAGSGLSCRGVLGGVFGGVFGAAPMGLISLRWR